MEVLTETFRGYGKKGSASAHTAVECRFGGEIEGILATHAHAVITSAEAGNGEVKYTGKAVFTLVYEDGEKHVCRAEKGVEFTAKAECAECVPAYSVRVGLTVENLSARKEGASVYLTALLGADVVCFGEIDFDYLVGGDLVCKRESAPLLCAHLCSGRTETEDEFETEDVGDVLLHAERVSVASVTSETGALKAEGEINLSLLAVKEGALVSFERLVPFRIEIPCEEASLGSQAEVRVTVDQISIRADSDENKGKCKFAVTLVLFAEGCVFEEVEVDGVSDAFSPSREVFLGYGETETAGVGEVTRMTERVSGKAGLSSPITFADTLQAIALQRAEANLVMSERGRLLEGVVLATLLVVGTDGTHRGVEMSLPFSLPVEVEGNYRVGVLACGTSASQRQEGEIDAEVTLKITLQEERTVKARLVSSASAGETFPVNDNAISVYLPTAGDGLWELAKRLKKAPEDVSESNPDLQFPIQEGQRVIVYRKRQGRN